MVKLSHPQNLNQTTYCLALSEIIDNNLNLPREVNYQIRKFKITKLKQ
jgi:hypothetical protein